MENNAIKRISLWSGPRNISTALMYSFANRPDTKVFDEPLYGFYLNNSSAKNYHPGAEDILKTMEKDGHKVVEMMASCSAKPVLFFKNMTHHLLDLDLIFMKDMINIILTRDPLEMLPSFNKVIKNPNMDDVGYKAHVDLLDEFERNDINYIVLDAKYLLMNPESVLKQLCQKIDIPFSENMLNWEVGPILEDGIWAKYWYDGVHNSTTFKLQTNKIKSFPEHLKPLLRQCQPYYRRLQKLAIR